MATLLENVIKKVLSENFIRYLNGEIIDKDDNPIPINMENNGGSGLIPHFAYASDPSGNGFTLVTSTELEYIAIKVAAPDAVLTAADFSGLWFHRKGLPGASIPGADGINGKNGGFPCIYSSDTDETQPDQGGIKFNNANPALATEMYISAMSPSGMDLTALLNAIPGGAKFMLSSDSPQGSTLAVFQFDATPTDNTDWFTL